MKLVTSKEFAQAFNITDRAARTAFSRAIKGDAWRGFQLPVTEIADRRGGASGKVWALALDHCSPDLRELLLRPDDRPDFESAGISLEDWQVAQQQARLATIRPILNTRKGTGERTAMVHNVSQKTHIFSCGTRKLSVETLQGWVLAYERDGICGLIPKGREDKGKRRVLVSRTWDAGIDLPDSVKQQIAEQVSKEARSMVSNDGESLREAQRLSSDRLAKYCAQHGSQIPTAKLKKLCKLNHKWAERSGLKQFRLVYQYDKDHKSFQDNEVGRIRRDLHPVPMHTLIGDVHYVDILVEENCEPVRVRLIAWMDASSLFLWVTPVFLPKGKGVCQEDVTTSLSQVAFCPHGGIPFEIVIDNGPEYKQIAPATTRLAKLAQVEFGTTLTNPYSPTSKGELEGSFHIYEQILKGIPGWIGGDRTNKKTENKGRVVEPYKKGLAQLELDIESATAIYNSRPQSGRLDGLSPLEMLQRKINDTGFVARVPSEEAFDLIFSKSDSRKIRQGMITFEGHQWYNPELAGLPFRTSVEILIPLRNQRDRIFVRHNDIENGGCWAEPEQVFQYGDRAGAKRQGELERDKVRVVQNLKKQVDPSVSTFEFQKEAIEMFAPNAPEPDQWTRAIDKTTLPPTAIELDLKEDKRRRADMEEYLAICGVGRREASGGNR